MLLVQGTPTDHAPSAANDTYPAPGGSTVLPVLSNDVDSDGDNAVALAGLRPGTVGSCRGREHRRSIPGQVVDHQIDAATRIEQFRRCPAFASAAPAVVDG